MLLCTDNIHAKPGRLRIYTEEAVYNYDRYVDLI